MLGNQKPHVKCPGISVRTPSHAPNMFLFAVSSPLWWTAHLIHCVFPITLSFARFASASSREQALHKLHEKRLPFLLFLLVLEGASEGREILLLDAAVHLHASQVLPQALYIWFADFLDDLG